MTGAVDRVMSIVSHSVRQKALAAAAMQRKVWADGDLRAVDRSRAFATRVRN
jgi:hypothetical protein